MGDKQHQTTFVEWLKVQKKPSVEWEVQSYVRTNGHTQFEARKWPPRVKK